MKTIDCRNQSCPAPVINVKKALEEFGEVQVYLDSGAPHENVTRFSRNRGYVIMEQPEGDGWLLSISSSPDTKATSSARSDSNERLLLITSDRLGEGSDELGRLLMKNYIHTLLEIPEPPSRIYFLNSGVFLACAGSDVVEALEKLRGMGTEIFSCGLCLEYFKLKDKLQTGSTTTMLTIAEDLMTSKLVIKL